MQGATCVRRQERLPGWFSIRLVDGHGVRPQELGPRCLAKRLQGAICVRRQERLPGWFSIRLVDGHVVRPQKLGPRCLAKRVQGVDRCPSPRTSPCLFWYASGLTNMLCVLRN